MMIYWIDESYVRDNLPVEYSLLSGNIQPALQQSHFINARDLCGDKLYDFINNLITTGDIQLPQYSNYKYLLDTYLQNVVLYWTGVYLTTNLLGKFANKGLSQETAEFASSADLSLYKTLKNEMTDYASYWSDRCNTWLWWNQQYFPEYQYVSYNGEQPASAKNKFRNGGLVLGQGKRFSYNNMCWY